MLTAILAREIQVLELGSKIQNEVVDKMNKAQREYFLKEQMKAIQKELGEGDERGRETDELKERVAKAKMPKEAEAVALKEIDRLAMMHPSAAEYTVSRTYLDWLVELPWSNSTTDRLDIKRAQQFLDEDHYGLAKVKDRIVEYLAVQQLKKDLKGPILCLVGPPGVGKTSLGRSIARSLGRKFVRMSLGGIRDEAEIRGHRRTYVGALPGRIIQGMRKSGSHNPVFMLDELDKVGMDFRGDPTSALLEVLDPEQNFSFSDHYLEVAFDLSKTMFIATANILDTIPQPLLDRMEVLRLPGYTEEEKLHIAKRHLLPRVLTNHGLKKSAGDLHRRRPEHHHQRVHPGGRRPEPRAGDVRRAAEDREGSRDRGQEARHGHTRPRPQLPRAQAGLPREPGSHRPSRRGHGAGVDPRGRRHPLHRIHAHARPRRAVPHGPAGRRDEGVGPRGALLDPHALRRARREARRLLQVGPPRARAPGRDPEGRPLRGRGHGHGADLAPHGKLVRDDVAMTGEITLTGKVLPVGGIKEKVLAAKRAGMKEVILPERNRGDLEDLTEEARASLKFRFVTEIPQALALALKEKPGAKGSPKGPRKGAVKRKTR